LKQAQENVWMLPQRPFFNAALGGGPRLVRCLFRGAPKGPPTGGLGGGGLRPRLGITAAQSSFSSSSTTPPLPPLRGRPPKRDASFAQVTADDVAAFASIVGADNVATEPSAVTPYQEDWTRKWKGHGTCVLRPRTSSQVAEILRHCSARKLAVVPQGGRTGLVGGSVPVYDEIVLSLTKLSTIESFSAEDGVVRCEAGVVLETLDEYLRERGRVAPLDLGAKGTCTIGGNASTNAGGVRFVRYGSLRGSIVGVEAVLADGTVLDCSYTTARRKDNTGYGLHQLFVGAEGTLGVITKVALATPPKPEAVSVALFSCASFDRVRDVVDLARRKCGEILSAVEFFDGDALAAVLAYERDLDDPLAASSESDDAASSSSSSATTHTYRVLVETSGSVAEHDRDKLEAFLAEAVDQGLVADGVVADTEAKARRLWRLREGISDAMTTAGHVYKYDVSVPLAAMDALVAETRARLADHVAGGRVRVAGYGHCGDGNLHLNVCSFAGADADVEAALEPWVFDRVTELDGSISAEHGLGRCKNEYLRDVKAPAVVEYMRRLKTLFDPDGILNPYKVLPAPGPVKTERKKSAARGHRGRMLRGGPPRWPTTTTRDKSKRDRNHATRKKQRKATT